MLLFYMNLHEVRVQIHQTKQALADLSDQSQIEAELKKLLDLKEQEKRLAELLRGPANKRMKGAKKHSAVRGKSKPKRYVITCQAELKKPDRSEKWVKYRCDDLVKLCQFLDRQFPEWCFFNVFSNRGSNKGEQLASYTKNNRPVHARV